MPQLMKAIKDSSTGPRPTQGVDPLWPALLQFLQEGLQRAGTMAGDATQRYSDTVERVASGKPMNAPGQASELGGLVNPIGAMIAPRTWKAMQPEAKAMLTELGNMFPDFFKKVLEHPTNTLANVMPQGPGLAGTQTTYTINPQMAKKAGVPEMAGKPSGSVVSVDPKYVRNPEVPLHELQHSLNFDRVAATDPADASTIGLLLHELMPKTQQGSLNMRLGQYQDVMAPQISAPMNKALEEVQHYGQQAYTPTPKGSAPSGGGQGYYAPGENLNDFYQRAMMDEGLAYMAEQSMIPDAVSKMPGDINLGDLAGKLNVGTSMPNPPKFTPNMDFQNLSVDQLAAQTPQGQGQVGGITNGEVDWDALLNSLGFGK